MIGRVALGALLAALPAGVGAQPVAPPDRTLELMQLQFNSRSTQPLPTRMDGTRASAIYKRFSEPATHGGQTGGQSSQGASASASGSAAQ